MTRVRMFFDIDPDGRHGGFGGLNPELFSRHELIHQGESAERIAARWQLSRQALDEFAIESHRRAWRSLAQHRARDRRDSGDRRSRRGGYALTRDEGVRERVDPAKMAALKTVFRETGGVITAGNASQISDGAAAVLVGDRRAPPAPTA